MFEPSFVEPNLHRLDEQTAELLIVCVWEDVRPLRGPAGLVDFRCGNPISRAIAQGFFGGALGETLMMPGAPRLPFDKIVALGLGSRGVFDEPRFRASVQRLRSVVSDLRARRAVAELPGRHGEIIGIDLALPVFQEEPADDRSIVWIEPREAATRILARHEEERRRARHI